MAADFVVTSGQSALSSASTKTLWLLAPGGVEARLIDSDISFDGSAAGAGIHVDLYSVTLNANNPAGGVAGTAVTPQPLNAKTQAASTTALAPLTTEPTTNTFTVTSCTTNNTANESAFVFSSNNFVTSGVAPGMTVTGTGIPGGTTVIHVATVAGTNYLILSQAATAAGTVTLTFTPVITVLKSWNITPYGGLYTVQLPLGREFVLPTVSSSVSYRLGLRATTASGITPSAVSNVSLEE